MNKNYYNGMVFFDNLEGLIESMKNMDPIIGTSNFMNLVVCLPLKVRKDLLKFSENYIEQIENYSLDKNETEYLRLTMGLMVVVPQNLKKLYNYYSNIIEEDFPDDDLQKRVYEIIGEQRIKYHTENGSI